MTCGQSVARFTPDNNRIVGYYRPVQDWNRGKKEEFALRHTQSNMDMERAVQQTDPEMRTE